MQRTPGRQPKPWSRVTEIENYLSVRHAQRPDRMRESFAAKALREAPHADLAPLAWGTPIQQNKASLCRVLYSKITPAQMVPLPSVLLSHPSDATCNM